MSGENVALGKGEGLSQKKSADDRSGRRENELVSPVYSKEVKLSSSSFKREAALIGKDLRKCGSGGMIGTARGGTPSTPHHPPKLCVEKGEACTRNIPPGIGEWRSRARNGWLPMSGCGYCRMCKGEA